MTQYFKHTIKRDMVGSSVNDNIDSPKKGVSREDGLHETALWVWLWEIVLTVLTDVGNPAHCGRHHSIGRGLSGKSGLRSKRASVHPCLLLTVDA